MTTGALGGHGPDSPEVSMPATGDQSPGRTHRSMSVTDPADDTLPTGDVLTGVPAVPAVVYVH